jgi:hypothetical protein
MARFLIPHDSAGPALEGLTCKHGHGAEHQSRNNRGNRFCRLCARADRAKYVLANFEKIREQKRRANDERGAVSRFSPEGLEAMKRNFAVLAEKRRLSATCDHGHLWAQNTMIKKSGARRCRECVRLEDKRREGTKMASQRQVSAVLEGLSHGFTLSQMTSYRSKKGVYRPHDDIKKVVNPGPIYNFCKAHPALGKKIKDASKKNGLANLRAACRSLRVIAAPALLRNNGADAFEAVQRATAGIGEDDRGDVQSLMWIAIGANKLQLPDCTPEKAREYLKIHRRRPNVYGSYSLDTPIGEDSGMTWLDTKTDEDRLWA